MKKLSKLLAVMTAFALIIGFTNVGSVELSASTTCKASGWTKGVSQGWADEFNRYSTYGARDAGHLYRKTTCSGNTKKVYISSSAGTEYKQYMRVEYNLATGKRTYATNYSSTKGSPGKNAAVRRTWYHSNGKTKQHNEYYNGARDSKAGYLISKSTKYDSKGRKTSYTTYRENGKREKHYAYTTTSGKYKRYEYNTAGQKVSRYYYYKSGSTSRRQVCTYKSNHENFASCKYYSKVGSSWKHTSTKRY